MTDFDSLQRFVFRDYQVRGELVRLQQSYQAMLDNHEYPAQIQRLLGELAAASTLLSATLKFKGEISLQIQSQGVVKYAVINGTHDQNIRGVARWDGELGEQFSDWFEKGVLAITITPDEAERYQGIVALDKPTLAECLEAYFEQSEQLPTRVWLHADGDNQPLAWGMLLQVLPQQSGGAEHLADLAQLTATMTTEEMRTLATQELLYRLYHEHQVEVFQPQPVQFRCSCSKDKSATALTGVAKEELLDIIAEQGAITMHCQYCNAEYRFDSIDVEAIHAGTFVDQQISQ